MIVITEVLVNAWYAIFTGIVLPSESVNTNAEVFIVDVSRVSLNATRTLKSVCTFAWLSAGTVHSTPGGVMSRVMVSLYGQDRLNASSSNQTVTFFRPSAGSSAQVSVSPYAKEEALLNVELETNIVVTGDCASYAVSLSVTVVVLVYSAPVLIRIVPVGGIVSYLMVMNFQDFGAAIELPALSFAPVLMVAV